MNLELASGEVYSKSAIIKQTLHITAVGEPNKQHALNSGVHLITSLWYHNTVHVYVYDSPVDFQDHPYAMTLTRLEPDQEIPG